MITTLKIAAAALVAGSVGYGIGHFRGEASGAAKALIKAERNFNSAVGELSDEADQARVKRRHCLDGGGVYDFGSGRCTKAKAD